MSKYYHFHDKSLLGNHKCTASHYIITHWAPDKVAYILQMVMHHCNQWPVAFSVPTHYLNQCCFIVNWTLRNKLNILRARQHGRHFPNNIFKCIFMNANVCISIKISLKFVPKSPLNNIPALVQIMAWHQPGAKPLSESMMLSLLMYICHSASMSLEKFKFEVHQFSTKLIHLKMSSAKCGSFLFRSQCDTQLIFVAICS